MRRLLREIKEWVLAFLFVRIKLPWLPISITVGAILTAILIGVIASLYGIHATSEPIFCTSCHEMQEHFKTWQVSTHKNVGCEDCHVMPGFANMVKTKLMANKMVVQHFRGGVETEAIKGHVPDVNCKKCHQDTTEWVTYHSLKISHKKHWNMEVGCTFCHDRVVHGPQAATINPPKMATCFKCHDGRRASNDCNTCHVTLGSNPKTMTAEWIQAHKHEATSGKEDCSKCHTNDFCSSCHRTVSPHPPQWLETSHVEEGRKKRATCNQCHQQKFCEECHEVKRAHSLNWLSIHFEKARQNPAECAMCHKQSFCESCHKIYKGHPAGWLARHFVEAKRSPKRCATCHEQKFCADCHQHQNATPPDHKTPAWSRLHGKQAAKQEARCETCHTQDFCKTCHLTRKPGSHTPDWVKIHGATAKSLRHECSFCHDEKKFCYTCHTMDMPHPENWRALHGKNLTEGDCARCHDRNECTTCHERHKPASHQNKAAWTQQHGRMAMQMGSNCATCHQPKKCDACHGTEMPHPSGWTSRHGKEAAQGKGTCMHCHTDPQFCTQCHQKVKQSVHPSGWMAKHGSEAKAKPATCNTCHTRNSCLDCHKTPMPHPSDWVLKGHKRVATFAKDSFCFKCHAQKFCGQCHAEESLAPKSRRTAQKF